MPKLTQRQAQVKTEKNIIKQVDSNIQNMTDESLKRTIRQLAKTSNQRLRALEKSGLSESSVSYKAIARLHFDKERYSFMTETGKGEIKFNTALTGVSREVLEEELATIRDFLGRRSSTVLGTKNLISDNWRKYNEKMEQEGKPTMTLEEFGDTFTSAKIKKFGEIYGSDEIVTLKETIPENMTTEQIEEILTEGKLGQYLRGELDDVPDLGEIYADFEKYKKQGTGIEEAEEGL